MSLSGACGATGTIWWMQAVYAEQLANTLDEKLLMRTCCWTPYELYLVYWPLGDCCKSLNAKVQWE